MRSVSVFCWLAITIPGCISYKQPTETFIRNSTTNPQYVQVREKAAKNSLYSVVPRDRRQIHSYDVPHWISWGLLGNERDGIFGEELNPPFSDKPGFKSFMAWQVRNPLTNFCFYVVGSADWKVHHSLSLIRADATGTHLFKNEPDPSVFGSGKSGVIFALNDYKPFFSLKFPIGKEHQSDFYIGWRPEGHLGIKLRPYVKSSQTN